MGKSRKDYEKFLNSISPDRDDEAWIIGGKNRYFLEKKVAFTKRYKDESREDEDCEEWEEVDSCWGCYEETDELIKEVMIENDLEE